MKKHILSFLVISLIIFSSLFSEEVLIDKNVVKDKNEYIGTYVEETFASVFESTRNFEKAKECSVSKLHLYVEEEDIPFYSFYKDGETTFLRDSNGRKYKRFTNVVSEEKFYSYLNSVLFSTIDDLKDVKVNNIYVQIGFVDDYYLTYHTEDFEKTDGVICYLKGYALKVSGISAKLYDTEQKGGKTIVTDKVLHSFPVFTYTPYGNLEDMSKEELRIYRNLQYAKHGYKFKSRDLRKIFENFEWYEGKISKDKDIKLTDEEKRIVELCLYYEKIPLNERKQQTSKKEVVKVQKEEEGSSRDYLKELFNGKVYREDVIKINNGKLYLAYHRSDNNKKIDDKALIYKKEGNKVVPLFIIDGTSLSNNKDYNINIKIPKGYSFYGWNIKVTNNDKVTLYLSASFDNGTVEADTIIFTLNNDGVFEKYTIPRGDL